jgi:hypothetical protein
VLQRVLQYLPNSAATVLNRGCSLSIQRPSRQGTALFIRALPVAGHWISVQLAHRRRQGGGTCSFIWELSINTAGPKNYDFSFLRSYKILHILKK